MYCTVEAVRQMLKDDILSGLLGDIYIDDPAEREIKTRVLMEQAIADAGAEIDGYLAKRYPVPLAAPPASIARIAKDIAIYNLISRIGVGKADDREQNYRKRYEDAVGFLQLLAKGAVEIGVTQPVKQAAEGFRMNASERLFSRESLKGM